MKFGMTSKKSLSRVLAAAVLSGAVVLSSSADDAEAKRLHDPAVDTQVTTTAKSERVSIKDRIQSILDEGKSDSSASSMPDPYALVPYSATSDILGKPMATAEQCVRYLLSVNPSPSISVTPEELVSYYYEEGAREGIRPDVAFAQALKETGFFRYGGTVTPDQNNYCGLGTTSAHVKGAYFPTARIGVRAHIQHLKAYASTQKPAERVVDPRYDLVRSTYGKRTLGKWQDLNGRWAVPGTTYGQSILQMHRTMVGH
ncbi:hypothetical protein TAMA11512_07650 [Selenomonas sp. TAMA-11512]|uniref:glucosaminidase domain-containing protein n=1 Tax=Selenomonas sp. TAMA-11512 TaxID=3095337 RepID=UPI0030862903|nr:hypothetical protein TAMA11512_07650 [Selenomonas sp. TAMA-11512]